MRRERSHVCYLAAACTVLRHWAGGGVVTSTVVIERSAHHRGREVSLVGDRRASRARDGEPSHARHEDAARRAAIRSSRRKCSRARCSERMATTRKRPPREAAQDGRSALLDVAEAVDVDEPRLRERLPHLVDVEPELARRELGAFLLFVRDARAARFEHLRGSRAAPPRRRRRRPRRSRRRDSRACPRTRSAR